MKIRQLIFTVLLLCTATLKAQFHPVDWSAVRGDSLLPLCTQVVELPSDYAAYNYSARIEYPEFQRMDDADVARYAIAGKYGTLPEMPHVECHVPTNSSNMMSLWLSMNLTMFFMYFMVSSKCLPLVL